ncbi:MAG TPA: hypothetical protein VMX55_07770 [candidate division Zixibacteria bacterium]|nr:hypothetical protein [candidate division Zixibacteria bacterium]
MKLEKIFTIASIATFFALLPALIYMEVRVLSEVPNITYLFVIMDILLVAFMGLEIFLLIRKWKKGEMKEDDNENKTEISKEWGNEKQNSEQISDE